MTVSGTPAPVLEGVGVKTSGGANFDFSTNGRLVYAGGGSGIARTIAWVDRSGRETAIAAPIRNYFYARVSPDGKRLSLDVRDQEEDIWIWDIARETMTRLTDRPGADQYGLWTLDAQRVVFSSALSGRQELFSHRPDGVGQPEQLTDTASAKLTPFPNAITPDGRQVVFRAAVGGKNDLFVADIGRERAFRKLLSTEHDERNAALSPDGTLMAFESDLSGKVEVYVRPFPDVNSRQWPVSTAGGSEAVWAPKTRELFYVSADSKLMACRCSPVRSSAWASPRSCSTCRRITSEARAAITTWRRTASASSWSRTRQPATARRFRSPSS
jgi:serine/threonine-protein kinase